jgi:hypothetical protein
MLLQDSHVLCGSIENTQLAPSEHRSHKTADGRVATEAAWLRGKDRPKKERYSLLTGTGLLMEGLSLLSARLPKM